MKIDASLSTPDRRRLVVFPKRQTPLSEAMAAFMGTTGFIYWMAGLLLCWVAWNVVMPAALRFDPYPFQFLTLTLSVQASFSAPLILLAQYKQEEADRLQAKIDRDKLDQSRADTDFLARELMDIRGQMGGIVSRSFMAKELAHSEERVLSAIDAMLRQRQDGVKNDREDDGSPCSCGGSDS